MGIIELLKMRRMIIKLTIGQFLYKIYSVISADFGIRKEKKYDFINVFYFIILLV